MRRTVERDTLRLVKKMVLIPKIEKLYTELKWNREMYFSGIPFYVVTDFYTSFV